MSVLHRPVACSPVIFVRRDRRVRLSKRGPPRYRGTPSLPAIPQPFGSPGTGTAAAYSDTTLANEGGAYRPSEPVDIEYTAGIASYNIGWIRTGEWLVYTVNVATDGTYTTSFNAANPDAASKPVDVYVDGAKVGTARIGGTGSFGAFRMFAFSMTLPAGAHQNQARLPVHAPEPRLRRVRTGRGYDAADGDDLPVRCCLVHGRAALGFEGHGRQVHADTEDRQDGQVGLVVVRCSGAPEHLELAGHQPDVLLPGRRHLLAAREDHLHGRLDRDG